MSADRRLRRCPVFYDYALHDSGDPAFPQPVLPLVPLVGPSTFPQAPAHGSTDCHTEAHPLPPYAGRQEPLGLPRARDEGIGGMVIAHERQHFTTLRKRQYNPTTPCLSYNSYIMVGGRGAGAPTSIFDKRVWA